MGRVKSKKKIEPGTIQESVFTVEKLLKKK